MGLDFAANSGVLTAHFQTGFGMRLSPWIALLFIAFTSCDPVRNFDEVPVIRLLEAYPDSLREGVDTFYLKVYYEDGDGDLGDAAGDTDFMVTDTRQGAPVFPPVVYPYALPNVTPPGQKKQIYGEIQIKVVPTYRRPGMPADTARIDLQLRDRAGHYSNVLTLPPIPVLGP